MFIFIIARKGSSDGRQVRLIGTRPKASRAIEFAINRPTTTLCIVSVYGERPVKSIRSTYAPCIVEPVGGAIKMSYYERSHMLYTAAPGLTPHSTNLV